MTATIYKTFNQHNLQLVMKTLCPLAVKGIYISTPSLHLYADAGHFLAIQFLIHGIYKTQRMFLITGHVQTKPMPVTPGGVRAREHQAGVGIIVVARAAEESVEEVLNQSHSLRTHSRKVAVINRGWICHDQLQNHRE